MLQRGHNGDRGGADCRGEPQHGQLVLRPDQGADIRGVPEGGGSEFGEFECDESYFGARRVRGKRGRGAAGKAPVFGLLKRGERVYVRVVENCSRESLMPIIQGLTLSDSTIYTDGWKAYDGLILNGYEHHRVSLETSSRIPP